MAFSDQRIVMALVFALLTVVVDDARAEEESILKPDSEIVITVFGEDNLTTKARISKSGTIEFPLIGSVKIGGKTVREAVAELTQRLSKVVVDPKVTLAVTDYTMEQAMVLGHVRKPGPVDLPDESPIDLLTVVAMAGGLNEFANPSNIAVRRRVDGKDRVFRLDARKLASDESVEPFYIKPKDIVTVAELLMERVTVMGQVKKPGLVEIPAGESLDILSAVAMAGGFSDTADPHRVIVRRQVKGKSEVHQIDAHKLVNDATAKSFFVNPRDVITVATYIPWKVTILGEVQKPGVIELPAEGGFDLLDVIATAGGYTKVANPKRITVRRRVDGEDKLYLINGKRLAGDKAARPFYLQPDDVITVAESFF